MELGREVANGKTKIVTEIVGTDQVLIESKDAITAGDGERRDQFDNKAELATRTTVNTFELLEAFDIPTHFVAQESDRTFRAQAVEMIPVEAVARRITYGSFLKRNPAAVAETRFDEPVFECFAKDDLRHDPIIQYDFPGSLLRLYNPKHPLSFNYRLDVQSMPESPYSLTQAEYDEMRELTIEIFKIIEVAWGRFDVTLVDLKIEFGRTKLGKLVVADVIDNDSWRIWPGGDPRRMRDKQLFRDDQPMSTVVEAYQWVADTTDRFPKAA